MEEEEEAHTAVEAVMEIVEDDVEAEYITTRELVFQIRKDCAMLLTPSCSTTGRSRPQTKQYHHGINSCNALAQITAKI